MSQSSERVMDRDDQFDKLVGSELMRPHVAADDARDLIEIDRKRRGLIGPYVYSLIINLGRSLELALRSIIILNVFFNQA